MDDYIGEEAVLTEYVSSGPRKSCIRLAEFLMRERLRKLNV
jgi:hypothetical protein